MSDCRCGPKPLAGSHHIYIDGELIEGVGGFGGRYSQHYADRLTAGDLAGYTYNMRCCCDWTSGPHSKDWRGHIAAGLAHAEGEPADLFELLEVAP